MRDGAWKKVAGLSAALLTWAGLNHAQAQQYDVGYLSQPQSQQVAYSQEEGIDEIADLRARLDRYEAELAALRGEGHTQFASDQGDINARLTALESNQGEKKEEAAKGEPKKIELIKKPEMKLIGRIFFDHCMFDEDGILTNSPTTNTGLLSDETGFRTIRIGASGQVYENVKAQVEFEFEGEETDFKDCYIELQELGYWGYTFRAGYFKEPFSLEELTGDSFTTFMERNIANTTFSPARSFGVSWYDYLAGDEDITWAFGVFRDNSRDDPVSRGSIADDNGAVCFTARLAGNPYYDEPSEGRCLTHLGAGYSFRNSPQSEGGDPEAATFVTRQELGSQPGYLEIAVDEENFHLFNAEAAFSSGPVGASSEIYMVNADGAEFWGTYVEGWYFLTGEARGYRRDIKAWDRCKPFEDFFCVRTANGICRGSGAWQLKARFSFVDLDDASVGAQAESGEQTNFSTGLNWYMNPYTRVMFDYVYNDIDRNGAGDGNPQFFGTRLQVDF